MQPHEDGHPQVTTTNESRVSPGDRVRTRERMRVLHEARLLDDDIASYGASFDRIARMAAQITGAPISLVSLVGDDEQRWVGAEGVHEPFATLRRMALAESACKYVLADDAAVRIDDAVGDPRVEHLPMAQNGMLRAYLGVPIRVDEGVTLGSMCLLDREPREWTDAHIDVLNELARWVTAEIEMRRRIADLERTKRLRDEIAEMVSHDLRSPLTAILGASDLLRSMGGEMDAAQHERLTTLIGTQGRRMEQLIDDLHDTTMLEAGQLTLESTRVNVCEVIGAAVADRRGDFAVRCDSDLTVVADPHRLAQVVNNLATNAVKYGAAPFLIDVRGNGGGVDIRVIDHGDGIDQEHVDELFDRFWRAPAAAQSDIHGSGLGLSIAARLTTAMGGELTYERPDGGRSCFCVHMPQPT